MNVALRSHISCIHCGLVGAQTNAASSPHTISLERIRRLFGSLELTVGDSDFLRLEVRQTIEFSIAKIVGSHSLRSLDYHFDFSAVKLCDKRLCRFIAKRLKVATAKAKKHISYVVVCQLSRL